MIHPAVTPVFYFGVAVYVLAFAALAWCLWDLSRSAEREEEEDDDDYDSENYAL